MKLEKRASFLILPVLLLSYALVAFEVYDRQSQSLLNLEKARLALRLTELQSVFHKYDAFLESYETSLVDGQLLKSYLTKPNDRYRERVVSSSLTSAIHRFQQDYQGYASLAIINADNSLIYYTADSSDPFTTIQPEQTELAQRMQNKGFAHHAEFIHTSQPTALLMHGFTINPHTYDEPLATQLDNALKVVISIAPTDFMRLIEQTQTEYNANIGFANVLGLPGNSRPENPANPLFVSAKLFEGYSVFIEPDENYIAQLLSQLEARLTIVFFVVALVSFFTLHLLISRFITAPIVKLNEQLDEVMDNKRSKLTVSEGHDEISKLGRKFQGLYEALQGNLTNIHKLVQTDSLTGLPNRSAFQEHARNNLVRVNQANTSLSVIYIDLDNFKFVNDKYGHEIGDALLIAVADSFAKIVRPFGNGAETYRLSGDEFVALLPFADHQAAQRTGLEIIELFKSGYSFSLGHFPVTVSLGVATYPNDGTTLSKLTSNADLAMYQAKKSGKNRLATYSRQLAAEDRRIREIDTRLKALNCDDEFCIVYMPISDPSGRICGCEALLRWESPVLGAVPAADFIPIAESTGSFKKIDTWVLDRTFQDAAAIFERLPADGQIAINISSAQLASSQFVNVLSQLVKKHRIPPHKFTLEITETFELHKNTSVLDRLNDLRKLGFKVAIDDFGTGYTSLMQMVDYPVDSIKFDMHLTQRITTPEKQGIGIALIALCHLQNMHVVAEGIEEAEQLAFLCDAGCDFLQGFYLGEPLPLDAWLAWLDTHQDLADRSLSPAT